MITVAVPVEAEIYLSDGRMEKLVQENTHTKSTRRRGHIR